MDQKHRPIAEGLRTMSRVLVIGCGGAGKSTFAARLARRTGLPLIHLDAHFWKPGWVQSEREEWTRRVGRLLSADRWIMDGNYGSTLDLRLAACDTVFFLDLPRLHCLWRVIQRRIRYRHRTRPDMAPGCPEQVDAEFLLWIWNYSARQRPAILTRLADLRPDQRAIVLRSPKAVSRYIRRWSAQAAPRSR